MSQDNAVALRQFDTPSEYPRDLAPLTAQEIKGQVQLIQEVMQAVMEENYHYGIIPGTEKPTLLKPGAEKLATTFRLAPSLHVEIRDMGNGHREVQVRCSLTHIPTGRLYGEGVGSCTTLESRYRYRTAERTCPACGKAAIIKGKAEYGGGWLCFQRKGGCGAKFADQDNAIVGQPAGRVENADLADVYNTILKMAKKRALVDAVLTATAASDIFNQDLDEYTPPEVAEAAARATTQPQPRPQQQASQSTSAAVDRVITKGQLEIVLLSQRRSKVTDQYLYQYLTKQCRVTDLKDLKQKDLNALIEWLEAESHKQADLREVGVIPENDRKQLFALCKEHGNIDHDHFKVWLEAFHNRASTLDITTDQFPAICTAIKDGTVAKWIANEIEF